MAADFLQKSIKKLFLFVFACLTQFGWSQSIPLSSQKLEAINVKIEDVSFKGKKAVRVVSTNDNAETIAILRDRNFENGTIEIEVAGQTL